MSLSDLACRHAKPKAEIYRITDEGGLFLEIRPSGLKSWRLRYVIHGKENTLSIGTYPLKSLVEARAAREEAKALIASGTDPNLAKKEAQQRAEYNGEQTFEVIVRDWHKQYQDTWSEKTAYIILRRFELYMFPFIGKWPWQTLTQQQTLKCFRRIEKHSHDVSIRLYKHSNKVYRHAKLTRGYTNNPFEDLQDVLKKYRRGHFASIDLNELPELLTAMQDNMPRLYRQTYLALRLLMLTAVRTNELIKAKWPEIDFENAMWTIPASRMKMKQQHLVPLSRQALKIFAELKEKNGHREYVFPRKNHYKKPMPNCTLMRVLERIGFKGKMTGHGFRALFLGIAKEKLEYKHDVPDRQLAHVPSGPNGSAYDRANLLPQRTKLMQDYADYIDKISHTQPTQRTENDRTMQRSTNAIRADYTFNGYGGGLPYIQQYQPVHFIQTDQDGRSAQAEEKRTLQCVDGVTNSTVH